MVEHTNEHTNLTRRTLLKGATAAASVAAFSPRLLAQAAPVVAEVILK